MIRSLLASLLLASAASAAQPPSVVMVYGVSKTQAQALYRRMEQQRGGRQTFELHAGMVRPLGLMGQWARLQRMFATNVLGSFVCAREAVKRMSTAHGGSGGSIVNVSSAAARLGAPGQYVDYAAAKSAIDAFTIGLAKEVATEGIRVNAVRPGLIDTDIHASGGLPNRVRDLAHLVPMQRGGTSEEVAQAIVWLLSDAASYTTMSLMEISGGR